jgi:mono/diheme cytochrome c family protein
MTIRTRPLVAALAATTITFTTLLALLPRPAMAEYASDPAVARGRYLVATAGCNDCHTPGYIEKAGKVPETAWLTGSNLGWRGPWGTTYASNLRLVFQGLSDAQWVAFARTAELRPPMPWFNLRAMSDADLQAIYRYVRAMGPAGSPAPAYLPPGKAPPMPFVQMP